MNKLKFRDLLFLHITFFVYSIAGIFSKLASKMIFMSKEFILYYVIVIFILFLYAILWQQILKRLPLNTAFANKSVVIIWGIIWGFLLYKEKVTLNMIFGAILIIIGLQLVVTSDE